VIESALSVTNVSKAYYRYRRSSDRLKALFFPSRYRGEPFWALRQVSFEVARGHTVGVVGRNGSGKSTLLQIIAGTLQPTAGQIAVQGRVSALLELGSGFNPEFTGRENVHFQAALMGRTREEIEASFDSIASFADIGEFIDQPVRSYSSGMFVRLALAVAISIHPDILIVDEILSVGDEAFQRKCFSRIRRIQEAGGTILFVSHSGSAVVELCDHALLLDRGELLLQGTPKEVVSHYHRMLFAPADKQALVRSEIQEGRQLKEAAPVEGGQVREEAALPDGFDPSLAPALPLAYVSRGPQILDPTLLTVTERPVNVLRRRGEYLYRYRVRFDAAAFKARFGMLIKTVTGLELGGAASHPSHAGMDLPAGTLVEVTFRFRCLLQPATYYMNAGVVGVEGAEEVYLHRYVDVLAFRVQPEPGLLATGTVDFLADSVVRMVGTGAETVSSASR
jgi:lipopolysaccharide transport system ATP-binding protein